MKDFESTEYRFKGTSEETVIHTVSKFGHVYEAYIVYDSKPERLTLIYIESELLHGFVLFAEDCYTAVRLSEMRG